ncbi:MAG: 16S rRNA (cytosine(1402)-N(4))-methyltransferase RsmH [Melioribacteraceae bacterium]|nr:16S rRNA (cytosine(1402)-N(4))-methyltransferase RsmH [Melioribacteraceae bacterium]
MNNLIHQPVLLNESIEYLITKKNGIYVDATIGFGGHSIEFLKRLDKSAKLVGIDKDNDAYQYCKENFKNDERVLLYKTGFKNIDLISKIEFIDKFDGIFADLGVSSFQLDESNSGFTYREEAVLDLRMDKENGIPAYEVLNTFEESEIADILYHYGEEKNSRKLARLIKAERSKTKITTTTQLKELIEKSVPQPYQFKTLSRVFQALRIYVNNELDELREFLKKAIDLLNEGGKIVILSYHSLEDRIVKEQFKYENLDCICPPRTPICICGKEKRVNIITKKPVTPSENEIKENRRARSAKLRAAERV